MRKTKEQVGITLVALILTIIVLLILAGVTIKSVTDGGVIQYAQNAVDAYDKEEEKESEQLKDYINHLTGTTVGQVAVNEKATKNSTINGKMYSADNPVIPKGFMPINTGTSNWNDTSTYKNGLVISDGTSEFVWIPVKTLNEFARLQDGSSVNYRGVLYNWESDTTGKTEFTWTPSGTSYREPANLSTEYDNTLEMSSWTPTLYQDSFNKMVESVDKHKGFYIGRYEMSLNDNLVAQSRAGETSANSSETNNNKWHGLYEKAKTYSTSNTDLGVTSEMIWGCQWHAMLRWMLNENNITVTSKTPTDTAREKQASYNTTRVTGAANSNDILNNVYDLLGNSQEKSQEAISNHSRVSRGGYYGKSLAPSTISYGHPSGADSDVGTRLSLYVKV